ncbi:Protein ILITYHIA [Camellia lanceoleosa]|uniref:Protein ILITYHIA n=1 Tax=Camellia lanceoleosa TaxID=1840588 RepID=A0ACC0GBS4_9ERIC|nr:Protein ILITYHIA [Camellia lanceoleosa]
MVDGLVTEGSPSPKGSSHIVKDLLLERDLLTLMDMKRNGGKNQSSASEIVLGMSPRASIGVQSKAPTPSSLSKLWVVSVPRSETLLSNKSFVLGEKWCRALPLFIRSTATNVEIELPVPIDATNPNVRTSLGSASYAPENDALIWKIKSFPGGKVAWEALSRVVGLVPKEVLPSYIKLVHDVVSTSRDKERKKRKGGPVLIPGLCLPKALQPLLPIFLHVKRSKGYAFIQYTSQDDALLALESMDHKGRLKNGNIAAIKVLSPESSQGVKEFLTEIEHQNIVKLYGCCVDEDHRILVYNYLENNSLAQTLIGFLQEDNQRLYLRSRSSLSGDLFHSPRYILIELLN